MEEEKFDGGKNNAIDVVMTSPTYGLLAIYCLGSSDADYFLRQPRLSPDKNPSLITEVQRGQSHVPDLPHLLAERDDGRVATEYEVEHLLHVVDEIPLRTWIALFVGVCERFVWYGTTAPLRELPLNEHNHEDCH